MHRCRLLQETCHKRLVQERFCIQHMRQTTTEGRKSANSLKRKCERGVILTKGIVRLGMDNIVARGADDNARLGAELFDFNGWSHVDHGWWRLLVLGCRHERRGRRWVLVGNVGIRVGIKAGYGLCARWRTILQWWTVRVKQRCSRLSNSYNSIGEG